MQRKDLTLREAAYKEIQQNQAIVESDTYRQHYHVMPPVGLLNDPNGFIYWGGVYHLFFQWMPFNTSHGAKFWGHYTSKDLVDWQLEPIALTPSDWFDKDGCYSGSAIEYNGRLYVFYTGNVKNEDGEREAYQCLAVSRDGIHFEKKGVVIDLPAGYTAHFRDPKVWQHNDKWYIVIGAQGKDRKGRVVLYESENLIDWQMKGDLAVSGSEVLGDFGYMWECPDLFHLDSRDVLLFSPQGLRAQGMNYNNAYQSGYLVGDLDYGKAEFTHTEFMELDRGFEFYAPQTTFHEGRRLLIGWMGMSDGNEAQHPTHNFKWIHNMTIPRELELRNNKIYQTPIPELKKLRRKESTYENITLCNESYKLKEPVKEATELRLGIDEMSESATLTLDIHQYAKLTFCQSEKTLTLKRPRLVDQETESRSCILNELKSLRLFIDSSAIEIFVNNGEEVFTSRIFPEQNSISIDVTGHLKCDCTQWDLVN